jgi:hopene-associated glycosyltransferase HpnB
VPSFSLFLAALSLLVWLYLLGARGAFWRLRPFDDDLAPSTPPNHWPRVVAIIPARNEAETVGQAVTSLLQQDYPGEFSVILVDDHSGDTTSDIAQRAAQSTNAASRFTLLAASELSPGWTGKLRALNEGVTAAAPLTAEFFWFSDADIVHAPDTVRRLVSRAESGKLDLTSLMVLLQAKTLPERALIPAFLFFFLKLYPPRWIADERARTAGAAGGCVLLRRTALERVGGFAAIRGEVIDDCSLARAVKRSGGRIWMGLTRASVSLRAYGSFGEIRDMVARTAFTQLGYSTLLLAGTLAGLFLTYLVPVALAFVPGHATRILALIAWMLMSLLFLPTVRFYRISAFWSPLLPLTALFYAYATWLSALRYWLGRGGQWKGRAQASRPA